MKKITKITSIEGLAITLFWFISPLVFKNPNISAIFMTGATFLFLWFRGKKIDFKISFKTIWKMFKIILFLIVINSLYGVMVKNVFSMDTDSANQIMIETILKRGDFQSVMMAFTVVISAPLLEELIFRGYIQERLSMQNKKLGFFISWFIFAGMHLILSWTVGNTWFKLLLEFIPYGIISYIFCWYYYKHQNIGKNIILHSMNNLIVLLLVLLA